MECFWLLFDHLAWIKHQILSGIRDSRKEGSLWWMIRGVGGVRKSIHQSWLAKELGIGLGLLCWGFKGVQEEIPSEEASSISTRKLHQSTTPSLSHLRCTGLDHHPPYSPDLAPCDFPKLIGCRYDTTEEMKEAVMKIIDMLTQEEFHGAFQRLLER